MDFLAKNNAVVRLRKLVPEDVGNLFLYLQYLGAETKRRFGPHPFDMKSLEFIVSNPACTGYLAEEISTTYIIAYSLIRLGIPEHDRIRFESYGIVIDPEADCIFAPSVTESWQGRGAGMALFNFILTDLQYSGIKRIFLWGGVQADNPIALKLYRKAGFEMLGAFEHNGLNFDMLKVI